MLAGLVLKARPYGMSPKPAAVTDLHRFLALLGLGALVVHWLALLLDRTVPFHVADLLVPGIAPYRPVWTGLGVLAAELMLLVCVSFSLRKRIRTQNWRRLHWATYPIFALATAHGLLAGTDSVTAWALALYGGAVGAVVAATAWRMVVPPSRASGSFPKPPPRILRCRLAGGGMRLSACRAPDVSAGLEFSSRRRWARSCCSV